MKIKSVLKQIFLLVLLVTLTNCTASHQYLKETPHLITGHIDQKLNAMSTKNEKDYLRLIDETNAEYFWEQKHWFQYFRKSGIDDFNIQIVGVEKIDEETFLVTLKHNYSFGEKHKKRKIKYDAVFVKKDQMIKDSGLDFEIAQTEHFAIKYDKRMKRYVRLIGNQAERAYTIATKAIDIIPKTRTTIKLYYNQKLLNETVMAGSEFPTGGWYEYPESIKVYIRRGKRVRYDWLIAHELIHKVSMEITQSGCLWFMEGIAGYYGDSQLIKMDYLKWRRVKKSFFKKPIEWLEKRDVGKITDRKTIDIYYGMSKMVIDYMVETYGADCVKKILMELAKYPRTDLGYEYDTMDEENRNRFYLAMETLFATDKVSFNANWLEWISKQ